MLLLEAKAGKRKMKRPEKTWLKRVDALNWLESNKIRGNAK